MVIRPLIFFTLAGILLQACNRSQRPPQIYEARRKLQDGRECRLQIKAVPDGRVLEIAVSMADEPVVVSKDILASLEKAVNPEELIILDRGPSVLARFKLADKNGPIRVGLVIKRNYVAERELTRHDSPPEIVRYQAPPATLIVAPLPDAGLPTRPSTPTPPCQ